MKVLILTITAGEGHNNTAKALHSRLSEIGIETNILDVYGYISPALKKIFNNGYLYVSSKAKLAFAGGYRIAEKRRVDDEGLDVARMSNKPFAKKIAGFIGGYAPDVIVYTHPFAGMILDVLAVDGRLDSIKMFGILTDFTFHPFWEECTHSDYVVTANEMLGHQAKLKGFRENQVLPFGIPINEKFAASIPKADAKMQLGLDITKKTILLMGGSMGYGNMTKTVRILDAMDTDFQIIVVCGNNAGAKAEIAELNTKKRILNLGFVSNVDLLMDAADCIISKPGGLTTSEALAKRLPMIIINPIPGQEARNTEFLLNNGAALATSKTVHLEEAVYQLFANPMRIPLMQQNIDLIRKPKSTETLCNFIKDLF